MNDERERRPSAGLRSTRSKGLVFVVLCLVLTLRVLAAEPAWSQRPPRPSDALNTAPEMPILQHPDEGDFTQLIVALRAGQEMELTEFALARNSRIWVPAQAVLELVELRRTVDTLGVLRATLEPSSTVISLDPRHARVRRGDQSRELGDWELFQFEERLYASAGVLAWLLGVQVYEDMGELTVTFDPIEMLPLGRRLRRERMRQLNTLAEAEPDLVFPAEREVWSGATLDWGLSTPAFQEFERSRYGLAFGGSAVGGALDLRYRAQVDGTGPDFFDARWQGVWPEQQWLRQLELGGTRTTGPRGRAIRGVAVSNSPFLRSSEFGQTVLRGRLEPGWEVEVYRNGQLIAWDRVDERGTWEFTVPIDYGQNPVEIRAYGPNGEMQVTERAVRVEFDRIPAGQFEYGISAGDCQSGECEQTGNLDLRYGFNGLWTARAGYEGYRRALGGDRHYPYFSLSGAVADPMLLGAERVANAWWRGFASFESTSDFRLSMEHYRYDHHQEDGILTRYGENERSLASVFWRPWSFRRGVFFSFDGERVDTINERQSRARWGITAMLHGVRTSLQWNEEWLRDNVATLHTNSLGYQLSFILRSRNSSLVNGTQVRVQGEFDTSQTNRDWVQLILGRRVGRSARLEIGGAWYRDLGDPQLTVGLSTANSYAFMNANVTRDAQGRTNSLFTAEGSLLYNPGSNRVESYPYRALGQGGLSGTVFLDTNGNGIFDTGERGVPGVRLVAGNLVAETDEYGRYSVWNLVPFKAADIQVESSSLRNPLWIPVFERAAAAVSPNGFRRIDLPLVEGVEIEGSVRTRDGDASYPSGAVPLRLVQVDGNREYSTRSFQDGEFYLMSVAPGPYQVVIDASWLEARGLRLRNAQEREITISAGSGVFALELELEREAEPVN